MNDKEVDLKGDPVSDLPGIKLRLQHRLEHAKQLDDATVRLMQARAGNLADDEASIKITEHFQKIYEQSRGLDSVDSAAALDKEAAGLLQQSSARGVLSNSDALNMKEDSERRESYVKYAGTRSASSRSSWPQSHNSLAKVTDERGVLSRALDGGTSGTQLAHT